MASAAAPATDSVLIEPVGRPRRSLPRRMLNWVGNLLLLLCLAVFLLVAVGPHVFGYRTATMLTGSMEPGIMPGDVVVTTPAARLGDSRSGTSSATTSRSRTAGSRPTGSSR